MTAITIERNETSISRNANRSTKPKTSGIDLVIAAVEVLRVRGRAGHGVLDAVDLSDRAGSTSLRSVASAAVEASSVPLPASGISTLATVRSRLISTSIGAFIWPVASAFRLSSAIASRIGGGVDVVGLDRDHGRLGRAREGVDRTSSSGSISGVLMPSMPGLGGVQGERGTASASSTAPRRPPRRPGGGGRGRGSRPRCGSRRSCGGGGRTNGIRPFSTLSPSFESTAGRTVSEPSIATATTIIVADREGHERLVAGEEHAGHRDQDGDAGDEDGPAGGGCGGLERGALAATGGPLLALAADVEERVVDPDGETDQQDDLDDVLVDGDELARDRDQARRRDDRRDREQQRDQRRDERAEHEQQDRRS